MFNVGDVFKVLTKAIQELFQKQCKIFILENEKMVVVVYENESHETYIFGSNDELNKFVNSYDKCNIVTVQTVKTEVDGKLVDTMNRNCCTNICKTYMVDDYIITIDELNNVTVVNLNKPRVY